MVATKTRIQIDKEFKNLIPPLSAEELKQLEENIKSDGCRHALDVWDGTLVDGHNRYEICERLKVPFETQPIKFLCRDDAKKWIIRNQFGRRNLTLYVRNELALKLEEITKAKAKENLSKGGGDRKSPFPKSGKAITEPVHTDATLAKEAGVSKDTLHKARTIHEKAPEEVKDKLRKGETTINREYNRIKSKEKVDKIKAQPVIVPDGKYQCIVIDPPWEMQKIEREERPNQTGFDYPTMSPEELMAFPVLEMAADNCHLYLWATHKNIPLAIRLADHWGFKYQCMMTWVKNVGFTPFSWMYSTEHVLFCRKGSLQLSKLGMRLDFNAKVREHSRKPNEFYDLVMKASPGPRLDVFSREKRDGFDQYGNEAAKFEEAAA